MARILAISSQVARGHIGLSAIVPALQSHSHEVIALPTIILSNHPGHANVASERIKPDLLGCMLDAIAANGWLADVDAILTGYLPSIEHVSFAISAVERARQKCPNAVFLCDAVIGDEPEGIYLDREAATAIRDRLVPKADVLKCNRFEIEWLTGEKWPAARLRDRAAPRLGPAHLFVTSASPSHDPQIQNIGLTSQTRYIATVERRKNIPKGTGDLMSGLLLGYHLDGHAWPETLGLTIASLDRVIQDSIGRDELSITSLMRRQSRQLPPQQVEIIEYRPPPE